MASRAGETPLSYSVGENLRLDIVRNLGPTLGLYYLGGQYGLIGEGDVFEGPSGLELTDLQRNGSFVDATVRAFRLRTHNGQAEVWAATRTRGVFRRRGPGDWVATDLDGPLGGDVSTTIPDGCGRSFLVEGNDGFDFGPDGRLYYAPVQSSTFYTHTETDPCPQSVDLAGSEAEAGVITYLCRHENHLYFVKELEIWRLEI